MSEVNFSDRHPKYKHFTLDEWNLKYSFSYDDQHGFSDLKLFDMQNSHRFYSMMEDFGLPCDSSSFCNTFSKSHRRNTLIQRHLCSKSCYWDPQHCFLEDTHSGDLKELMHKDFHDEFNPLFKEKFDRNYSEKIDWSTAGGFGYYPSMGVKKVIEEMGITTKLTYDENKYAVNFNNLCREFRDSIPVRPLYVLEEKKCHDIVEALLDINLEKIEISKKDMEKHFDESYRGNGSYRSPILSLFMWGPFIDFDVQKSIQECKLDNLHLGSHVCTNFSEKHYWMYTHSTTVPCKTGPLKYLEGPVMTLDLRVVYPCNRTGCNEDCLCDLCLNCDKCPKNEHKAHIKNSTLECVVKKLAFCQNHQINHPENFIEKEDISIEKNIFYHNLKLVDQPRSHSVGTIKFAGIKRACKVCRSNVKNHFKHHKVIHLQCKFCVHHMKTVLDKTFWEKVCNVCGKICSDIKSLKYWHKKTHTSDWNCDECDAHFTRKWTLRRHLVEIHGMDRNEVQYDSEEDVHDDDMVDESEEDIEDEETDTEDSSDNDEYNAKRTNCKHCGKEFSVQRYLDAHMRAHHSDHLSFECDLCEKRFTQKKHLKRRQETVHGQQKSNYLNLTGEQETNTCDTCGANFTRIDNLNRHIHLAHLKDKIKFTCRYCKNQFDRKWVLNRHEQKCNSSISKK